MLTLAQLKIDVERRIARVQAMMTEQDIGALVVVGAGGPDMIGALRYITNAHLWSGRAYAVLGQEDPQPWLEVWSSYQAVWSRNETTTDPSRVETSSNVLERTIQLAKDYAKKSKRVGVVNMNKQLSISEYRVISEGLADYTLVDVTDDFNLIRQIKSPFEIEAMFQNGVILDAAMDVFRENARIGRPYWEICAATEAFIKSHGAFWGRTKLSFGTIPETVPPPKDLLMKEHDVINFEIVYESQWGYWLEMTTIFSFGDLPDEIDKLLQAYLTAAAKSSAFARPGNTLSQISQKNDQTFMDLGYPVAGKHTPDCHTIGLDGYDGPSLWAPETVLQSNMVLSFHPGTVMDDSQGLLVSDNFLVTPEGGVRLSPHYEHRYHLRLD